jgi:hypothetical protein
VVTFEGDGLVDEEQRGVGDAGGGLDLGDDGADAVAEGGRLVELRAEGLELRVHDGRGQPRRGLGVGGGGGGGVGRGGGAEAAQRGQDEGGSAGSEEGSRWGREGSGGGAEAERGGGGGGCCGCGSHLRSEVLEMFLMAETGRDICIYAIVKTGFCSFNLLLRIWASLKHYYRVRTNRYNTVFDYPTLSPFSFLSPARRASPPAAAGGASRPRRSAAERLARACRRRSSCMPTVELGPRPHSAAVEVGRARQRSGGGGATTRWGGRRVGPGGAALAADDCSGAAGMARQQDGEGGWPSLCLTVVDGGWRGQGGAAQGGRRAREEARRRVLGG